MATGAKGIPTPGYLGDEKLRRILGPMREALEVLRGRIGTVRERAVTVADLVDLGILGLHGTTLYNPNAANPTSFNDFVVQGGTEALVDNSNNAIFDNAGSAVLAQL
jgi:hypothetical protein